MTQKILLVEDDNTTADFVVKGLSEQGFAVDHANNGRDGLFHATDGTYDAIVLDRMLPGMDGMAVLGAIRAAGITTLVIILSALGAVEDRVAGLTAGSDDYLTKPFAFAELLARLKLEKGDSLFVSEAANGVMLTPYDPEVEKQIALGREFMHDFRDTFNQLAK